MESNDELMVAVGQIVKHPQFEWNAISLERIGHAVALSEDAGAEAQDSLLRCLVHLEKFFDGTRAGVLAFADWDTDMVFHYFREGRKVFYTMGLNYSASMKTWSCNS
jgi:hypothetical protein